MDSHGSSRSAASLEEIVAAKVEMMKKGQVAEAAEIFYADNTETTDFTGVTTSTKSEMIEKMNGFTAGIEKVNGITHHKTAIDGDVSFLEFTFDFDMSDGSSVLWHEIIRSTWKDGKIQSEQFFQG